MNMKHKTIAAACWLLCGSALTSSAQANPTLSDDPNGGGCVTTCVTADNWTNANNTGSDTYVGGGGGNPFAVGAVHEFTTQLSVSSQQLNGLTLGGSLNSDYEITRILKFRDEVTGTSVNGSGVGTVTFGTAPQANSVQMEVYIDKISTTGTQANASGTDCYGNGDAAIGGIGVCAGHGSGVGTDGGILVAKLNLIQSISSFTAFQPGLGTGSFDLLFKYTWADPAFLKGLAILGNGTIGYDRLVGTIAQPLQTNHPGHMWDGTPTGDVLGSGGHTAFTVISGDSFEPLPEPGTLALLSLGLLAPLARRVKK